MGAGVLGAMSPLWYAKFTVNLCQQLFARLPVNVTDDGKRNLPCMR